MSRRLLLPPEALAVNKRSLLPLPWDSTMLTLLPRRACAHSCRYLAVHPDCR